MSGNKLCLDSNIILYLLNGDETLAYFLDGKQFFISVITEMELLAFKNLSDEEEKYIKSFISECKTININNLIKEDTINIRKKYRNKLPDSIVAATALYLDIPLITADKGFKKIEELNLVHYEKQD